MQAQTRKERKPRLFSRLCDPRQLEKAWLDVLSHYAKDRIPGDLAAFDRNRARELKRIGTALRERTFTPEPASLIFIPKANHPDETRPITLTKPDDRIVLTALNRLIQPLFERLFLPYSYAYRQGRGALAAVTRVAKCVGQGLNRVACGDIDDFFSNIDRGRLLGTVEHTIWERPICELLETYLHMGVSRDFEWVDTGRGIAQGSPISPLLSNIALCEFDRFLSQLTVEWVRYADNFILLGQDAGIVQDSFERAEAFLLERCGLRLNAESRRAVPAACGELVERSRCASIGRANDCDTRGHGPHLSARKK